MMAGMQKWWLAHSRSEQWIMAVLGALVLVVLLWLGVLRPLTGGIADAWLRQGEALDRYATVKAQTEALKALPASAPVAHGPIDQYVSQSAAQAGFTLDRASPSGQGGLAIAMNSARSGPLLAWLAQLEGSGIAIRSISIVPGNTEGVVSVQAQLSEARP